MGFKRRTLAVAVVIHHIIDVDKPRGVSARIVADLHVQHVQNKLLVLAQSPLHFEHRFWTPQCVETPIVIVCGSVLERVEMLRR